MTQESSQKKFILICCLLVVIFAINLILCYFNIKNINTLGMENYKKTTSKIYYDNNAYIKEASGSSNNNKEEPLYKTSLDAVLNGVFNLEKRSDVYFKSLGTITTDALGARVVVKSEQEGYKYSQSEFYQKVEKYQVSGIDMGQTNAKETYSIEGATYNRTTESLTYSNGEISSNFASSFAKTDFIGYDILKYNFNKNTIKSAGDLVIYYNNDGSINHYAVEFSLNPTTSTTRYASVIYNEAKDIAKGLPTFYEIKMRMEIDKTGQITVLSVYEYYLLPVFVSAYVTNEFTYTFLNLNDAPKLDKPQL